MLSVHIDSYKYILYKCPSKPQKMCITIKAFETTYVSFWYFGLNVIICSKCIVMLSGASQMAGFT